MKLTKTSKAVLLGSASMLAFAVWQMDTLSPCSTATTKTCNEVQRNWVSWLSGDSRSAQFHFVDFLELISRMTPSQPSKP